MDVGTIQVIANEFLKSLALGVVALAGAYATYGIRKFVAKLKVQTQFIQEEEQRKLVQAALEDVAELTEKTVAAIEQTTAKQIREAVKDGKIDRTELEQLAKRAAFDITETLKPETQKVIDQHFGGFQSYLEKCIEAKVLELKTKS